MRPSRILGALAAVAALFFALPLVGLLVEAPWGEAGAVLSRPAILDAVWLSVWASAAAAALALALGFPLAWALARLRFPGRGLLRAVVVLPMVLPPVVAGVGLLAAFGRRGLLGGALETLGISLPFSTAAVVLAAAFVAAPFLVVTVEAGIARLDPGLEEAAATLGAGEARILRTVVLPELAPSLAAGIALAWARALGEFGATITFAGSLRGRTRTMPLAVFETLQTDPGAAILLSVALLAIAVALLGVLRGGFPGTRR